MNPTATTLAALLLALGTPAARAQETTAATTSDAATATPGPEAPSASERAEAGRTAREPGFDGAARDVEERLARSLDDLARLREEIAAEKLPLARKLSELESELMGVRQEAQRTTRLLDSRTLDLSNLRTRIGQREDEITYLSGLLGEYIRNFESRLHIAELQRYGEQIETAVLAPENAGLSQEQVFLAQAALLDLSFDRLTEALSGARFEGTAVDDGGRVQRGTFALVGPAGLFLPEGAAEAGTAEQRLGSLAPALRAFGTLEQGRAAARVVSPGPFANASGWCSRSPTPFPSPFTKTSFTASASPVNAIAATSTRPSNAASRRPPSGTRSRTASSPAPSAFPADRCNACASPAPSPTSRKSSSWTNPAPRSIRWPPPRSRISSSN
jgi:hypothetical protein